MKGIEGQIGFGKAENHSWEWVEYPSREDDRDKAWQEYKKGLDGMVSIRQLKSVWKTRWRIGKLDVATELTHRRHLWRLVENLEGLEGWDLAMAMEFLQKRYPIGPTQQKELQTAGNFVRWLQKDKSATKGILVEAAAYL
ncbi:hypothetical protein PQX77_019640 [Marasmius sp. AFHP31]|nr:hypothetical protein PQX77_019640 [Marasmius sp. AFHP31]